MVLTPEGKISRYFYGIQYPERDLRLGLGGSVAGKDRLAGRCRFCCSAITTIRTPENTGC